MKATIGIVALMLGVCAGFLLPRSSARPRPCPETAAAATRVSEPVDAGPLAPTSSASTAQVATAAPPLDITPPPSAPLRSLAGEWVSSDGAPLPQVVITDRPGGPFGVRAWGPGQLFLGCDVYDSGEAYCKRFDSRHKDEPLALRKVRVSGALSGDGELALFLPEEEPWLLRRGRVDSGHREAVAKLEARRKRGAP